MDTPNAEVDALVRREYRHGFVTELESDTVPPGLDEDVIRLISRKKREPAFLTEWRLRAYRHWLTMSEPRWANLHHPPIDYDEISYYSAPKSKEDGPKSLDEVDPKLLETYEKLGIPLHERAALAGVAVDAVFDSVSVATTFKDKLAEQGIVFCSFSEAVQRASGAGRRNTSAPSCPTPTTSSRRSTPPCSATARSLRAQGRALPDGALHLFPHQRAKTGQFERTLIVADEGSYVSYLEGLHRPGATRTSLHAAVVELVALDDAEIKYSTVQNWYPGDENGVGGIYNFVTKRGACRGAGSKISWTQVETGSAITWKYPSCILQGDDSVGEFYSVALTNLRQQADTGTKMIHIGKQHPQHHRLEGHLGRARAELLPGPRPGRQGGRRRPQLHPVRLAADRRPVRRAHLPLHRGEEPEREGRARGHHLEDRRRPALLLPPAGHRRGGRHR